MTSIKYFIACLLFIASFSALAAPPTFSLPHNQWRIISLPATPPDSTNTVEKILGDDMAGGVYKQNWIVYAYDTTSNSYGGALSLSDTMEQGKGYWIIQNFSQDAITLDMPENSTEIPAADSIPLAASKDGSTQWNLAGNPLGTSLVLENLRLTTTAPSCNDGGCGLDKAKDNNLVHNKVWTYDGQRTYDGQHYKEKGVDSVLQPWEGFWVATLGGSSGYDLSLKASAGDGIAFPGKLKIGPNKHMLTYSDGTGFFWMGDTAWMMPVKLNREEVDFYMQRRASSGFNVIQINAVQNLNQDNIYRESPFNSADYSQPNEKYWKHMDYIIESARKNNMYIALLPSWNTGVKTLNDAKTYGAFIAERYKDKSNIIWVIGGDSDPDRPDHTRKEIWNAMGYAIKNIVGSSQLITYHPGSGDGSTKWFHNESWLDFNMIQSGHCRTQKDGIDFLKKAYNKSPTKPIIDGEPRYETIEECFYDPKKRGPRFTAKDVREMAYQQLFSGAFGHTYGHHSVWQFSPKAQPDEPGIHNTVNSWKEALKAEGAGQMAYVANLMRSRPILGRVPDQSIVANDDAIIATRGDGYLFAYLPNGGSVNVNLGKISGDQVKAWWYNPITGDAKEIGTYENSGTQTFDAKDSNDWVLVLDDINKGYQTPGSKIK